MGVSKTYAPEAPGKGHAAPQRASQHDARRLVRQDAPRRRATDFDPKIARTVSRAVGRGR